jgi:hypothetical protein
MQASGPLKAHSGKKRQSRRERGVLAITAAFVLRSSPVNFAVVFLRHEDVDSKILAIDSMQSFLLSFKIIFSISVCRAGEITGSGAHVN